MMDRYCLMFCSGARDALPLLVYLRALGLASRFPGGMFYLDALID